MNQLSFTTERKWFGLCFVLLVDGVPIYETLNTGSSDRSEAGIPSWLVEEGLPCDETDGKYLVAVCCCGEEGCGHTRCRVSREGDAVVFDEFIGEWDHPRPQVSFVFPAGEFEAVDQAIVKLARGASRK